MSDQPIHPVAMSELLRPDDGDPDDIFDERHISSRSSAPVSGGTHPNPGAAAERDQAEDAYTQTRKRIDRVTAHLICAHEELVPAATGCPALEETAQMFAVAQQLHEVAARLHRIRGDLT